MFFFLPFLCLLACSLYCAHSKQHDGLSRSQLPVQSIVVPSPAEFFFFYFDIKKRQQWKKREKKEIKKCRRGKQKYKDNNNKQFMNVVN